jgi:cell division protein ZipA
MLIATMNFRDWLIVVGVVIILGILVDGYRRMRLAKQDSLKMSRNMGGEIQSTPLDDDYNPELPGGGARIVGGAEDDRGPDDEAVSEFRVDESTGIESSLGVPISADSSDRADFSMATESSITEEESPVQNVNKPDKERRSPAASSRADVQSLVEQEVIVINVDAKSQQVFKGEDIKKLLEACGMDHGEMSIFHRHEENDLLSPIQFSVANAVEPGYFDPSAMDTLKTPGVSFFLSLPGPKDYMKAFDYMLETAQCFATNLEGELSDERRSVLTKQTIEHFRTRVREFERKQLSKIKA